jgi:hypothetical protein
VLQGKLRTMKLTNYHVWQRMNGKARTTKWLHHLELQGKVNMIQGVKNHLLQAKRSELTQANEQVLRGKVYKPKWAHHWEPHRKVNMIKGLKNHLLQNKKCELMQANKQVLQREARTMKLTNYHMWQHLNGEARTKKWLHHLELQGKVNMIKGIKNHLLQAKRCELMQVNNHVLQVKVRTMRLTDYHV